MFFEIALNNNSLMAGYQTGRLLNKMFIACVLQG